MGLLDANPSAPALPGIDMAQLQALAGQIGLTDEQERKRRAEAAIVAALAAFATPKGQTMQGLSRAGLLGVANYSQGGRDLSEANTRNMALAMHLQQAAQQQAQLADTRSLFSMGGAPQAASAAAHHQFQNTGESVSGYSVPQAPVPGRGSPLVETLRDNGVSDAEIMLAARSANPQAAALKLLEDYRKPTYGQGRIPIVRGRNDQFRSVLPEGAIANAAGMEGATTLASELAKAQTQMIDVPNGMNGTIKMPVAEYLQYRAQAQAAPPVQTNFSGTPQEQAAARAAMQADQVRMGYGGLPQLGVLGQGPSPLQVKAAEAGIDTRAKAAQEVNKGAIGQIDKSYETASQAATQGIPLLHEARRMLDSGKIITGAGANIGLQVGSWLSQAGFKAADDPTANTQAFMATQARQVLSIIKTLGSGSGISDADREYAAKIVGGDIRINEDALRKLIDISERAQRASINAHNTRTSRAASVYANPDIQDLYGVSMPDPYAAPMRSTEPAVPTRAPTVWRYDERGRRVQ